MAKKSAAFRHLQAHFRQHKGLLVKAVKLDNPQDTAISLGAIDCLYWQALGNDEVPLAKGMRRLIKLSYQFHPIRVLNH